MRSKSIKGKTNEEVSQSLRQAMVDGFSPTVAIVFISVKQNRKEIAAIFQDHGIDVLGATSSGEFINGYQSEGEIAVLLLELSKEYYCLLWEEIGESTIEMAAANLSRSALDSFNNPSLILCTTGMDVKGEYFDGELLVKSLERHIGADKIFFGGMAGDDGAFSGTYIFIHSKETDCGLAALVLDGNKVSLSGMAVTGWKPMGLARTVTKSQGNRIYTIDDSPAVDMYFKYLGKEEKRADGNFNLFEELGFTYPFISEREPGGDKVLRTPIKIDQAEDALVVDLDTPVGTKLWFSMPPDFDIVDEVLDEAATIKNTEHFDADALLIFSCAGRQPVLGPLVTAENDGLAKIWNTPMAGFFTYGEYGRTKKGKQEFHSGACCWVALKEKLA